MRLSALTPIDGTRVTTNTVTVAGTVRPAHARVLVDGRQVTTASDGSFSVAVPLSVGTNFIDVIAGAPNARAAMTAMRVLRYVLIRVPAVEGQSPSVAVAAIRAAGLKPVLKDNSDPLAFLVPLSSQVCGQSPGAHARVQPGSTVTLSVGKVCF